MASQSPPTFLPLIAIRTVWPPVFIVVVPWNLSPPKVMSPVPEVPSLHFTFQTMREPVRFTSVILQLSSPSPGSGGRSHAPVGMQTFIVCAGMEKPAICISTVCSQ